MSDSGSFIHFLEMSAALKWIVPPPLPYLLTSRSLLKTVRLTADIFCLEDQQSPIKFNEIFSDLILQKKNTSSHKWGGKVFVIS